MRRPEGGKIPTRLGRLRRRLGFDRNDMRRRIDRLQWAAGLALACVFFLVASILGAWAGMWSYQDGSRMEQRQRATRWQVAATVVGHAGVGGERYLHQTVQATWQAPDGKPRSGRIAAWRKVEPGDKRNVWVDRAGNLTTRPRPHSRTVVDAGYAATGAILAVGLPILTVYLLLRRRCDHVRYALWDAEWAKIDPHRIS